MLNRLAVAFLALLLGSPALAQVAPLQAGPWTSGHAAMYGGNGGAQPIVQDAGPAGGGSTGSGISEIGVTKRNPGGATPPYAGGGTGPYGTSACIYDAPITNTTGYHYICFDPNAQGGPLIATGYGGAATALPLTFIVNGSTYQFPFTTSGVIGPGTTVVGDLAVWNNTAGTLLKDVANLPLANMPLIGAGTFLANITGGSAVPTAQALPSTCNTSSCALGWTGSAWVNNTSIAAATATTATTATSATTAAGLQSGAVSYGSYDATGHNLVMPQGSVTSGAPAGTPAASGVGTAYASSTGQWYNTASGGFSWYTGGIPGVGTKIWAFDQTGTLQNGIVPETSVTNVRRFDGRLTVQPSTPVLTTTVAGSTALYYAPYIGNLVSIYNGTNVTPVQFTSSATDTVGLTLNLGSNWAANSAFDVFVTLNAGSPTLCTVAWTNILTRATALALYNGLQTNGASVTCRNTNASTLTVAQYQGTYLGSFYTNGSTGQIDYSFGGAASGGSIASFGVYNYYNQVLVSAQIQDNGSTYTYSSATIRQARASGNNEVAFMVGVSERAIQVSYTAAVSTAATAGSYSNYGVGLDTTTAFSLPYNQCETVSAAVQICQASNAGYLRPAIGVHTLTANEQGDGTHTDTFNTYSLNSLFVGLWQ